MGPEVLSKLFMAFILSAIAGNTVAKNKSNTQHPLVPILQESFEHWQTMNPLPNVYQNSTGTLNTITQNNSALFNAIVISNKVNTYQDFPAYDGIYNHLEGEKRICKRYFTNDAPRKKSVYYINGDSKSGQRILKALPEIYGNSKHIQNVKGSEFLSLPNKRSPNIKVLTIDLVTKGGDSINVSKNYSAKEVDEKSLLGSKMGKGEFLILVQQPKNQVNINNILHDIATSSVKKDSEENEENFTPQITSQVVQNPDTSNVSAALSEILKLYLKSEAYYNDLSSRLNDFYNKIIEAKSQ